MDKNDQSEGIALRRWQVEQLRLIADLIRGDWSGSIFDGRDVKRWIESTLDGKDVRNYLKEIQDEY